MADQLHNPQHNTTDLKGNKKWWRFSTGSHLWGFDNLIGCGTARDQDLREISSRSRGEWRMEGLKWKWRIIYGKNRIFSHFFNFSPPFGHYALDTLWKVGRRLLDRVTRLETGSERISATVRVINGPRENFSETNWFIVSSSPPSSPLFCFTTSHPLGTSSVVKDWLFLPFRMGQ